MTGLTPRALSFRLAIAISLACGIVSTFVWLYYNEFNFFYTTSIIIVIFIVSYGLLIWGIKVFLENKFRLIFKTIHSLKVGLKKEAYKVDTKEDVFGKIREEVIEWDSSNRAEIERLTGQEKFRKEFIGNFSHELKTPLFSIQGYILTLLEGGLEDRKINRTFLLKAEKSINRMIDMVEDLDDISKLESNRIQLKIERFNLVKLAHDVLESLEYKAEEKGIKLKIDFKDEAIYVKADASKIAQVFTNLIANSIHYGSKEGKTSIKFFDLDEHILIEVKDTGKGIEQEHLPRLFERFYRVDKGRSRADGGSGLGLAIVKHILEAHNQSIDVRSTPGKGSVFSFTLAKA